MVNKGLYGFISVPMVIVIGMLSVLYSVPLQGICLIIIFMAAMDAAFRDRRR